VADPSTKQRETQGSSIT